MNELIEEVVLFNASANEYHRGFRPRGSKGYRTLEQCNLDQVGKDIEERPDLPTDVDDDRLCGHCWQGT